DELLAVIYRAKVGRGEQGPELLRLGDPYRAGLLAVGELTVDLGEPIAAVAGQLDAKRGLGLPQFGNTAAEIVAQDCKAASFGRNLVKLGGDQLSLDSGEVVAQCLALRGEPHDLGAQPVVFAAVGQQRLQRAELRFR